MTAAAAVAQWSCEERARQSRGLSHQGIYAMVVRALAERQAGGILVDVGCGTGQLWPLVQERFSRYVGVDAVCYAGFPEGLEWHRVDLNSCRIPVADAGADTVIAVETIEHLENPRAFMRELMRILKPGGWLFVTTPNILSLLSFLTLAIKQRFANFHDANYPAHITPLLEADLRRIAAEGGLRDVEIAFSHQGRLIFTSRHYPWALSRLFPRAFSDNLLLAGRKPHALDSVR